MRHNSFKIFLILALFSTTSFAQWVMMSGQSTATCFTEDGSTHYTGVFFDGVHRSTNSGLNWIYIGPQAGYTIRSITISGTRIFAGSDHNGVFVTSNGGANWVNPNTGLSGAAVYGMASIGSSVFAGTEYGGVFLTTNNGAQWNPVNNGLTSTTVIVLIYSSSKLYAGTFGGIFVTTNNGALWTPLNNGITNLSIISLTISGNKMMAGTLGGGAFYTSNGGTSWTAVNNGLTGNNVRALVTDGVSSFAGVDGEGVFYSSNNGQSWVVKNSGFPVTYIYDFLLAGGYIFMAAGNGVWRRSLPEITEISQNNSQVPESFRLYQNYPNPFNPGTSIKIDIPAGVSGNVNLVVYNELGKEVSRLIDGEYKPGTYKVEWDASNYPSGVYFYKLIANGFTNTKKMVLIK
jgi:ligand-binding sensor domain-containing protein